MVLVRGATFALIASGVLLSGCSSDRPFGPTVGDVFGGGSTTTTGRSGAANPAGIGVNAFLWRATLDTMAFMPLATADPWGGVINYDWYIDPANPNERFKATVFILDTRLRADALNVTVTKEVRDATGAWIGARVAAQTETDLENAILTKARQLNLQNAG
ncbi:MAG TPA: DUF3576 domain-containing protein [Brevundimonas sp.]|nr:DUF3576 domain-containing protein [Brevundimonas sp.]